MTVREQPVFEKRTHTTGETEAAGASFAELLLEKEPGGVFCAMYGDLGAGKTAFVRGAASVIAPGAHVQSPTYTIVNEYHGARGLLLHFDMYRIDDEDSLDSVGYWDYLERGGYCFAEWSEKIPYALPEVYYRITVTKDPADPDARTVTVTRAEQEPCG